MTKVIQNRSGGTIASGEKVPLHDWQPSIREVVTNTVPKINDYDPAAHNGYLVSCSVTDVYERGVYLDTDMADGDVILIDYVGADESEW